VHEHRRHFVMWCLNGSIASTQVQRLRGNQNHWHWRLKTEEAQHSERTGQHGKQLQVKIAGGCPKSVVPVHAHDSEAHATCHYEHYRFRRTCSRSLLGHFSTSHATDGLERHNTEYRCAEAQMWSSVCRVLNWGARVGVPTWEHRRCSTEARWRAHSNVSR
jgi:hypothetical protein